jgi:uncharacterized membrane-anchored protein
MYCGRCGNTVADSSLFCSKCGFDLHMGVRRSLLDERDDPLKERHTEPSAYEDLLIRAVGVILLGILGFLLSSQLADGGTTPTVITASAFVTSLALVLGGLIYLLICWYGKSNRLT